MPDRIGEFIAELARNNPDTVARILRTHVADEHDKCGLCHLDDKQRQPWPCGPYRLAERAQAMRATADLARGVVHIPHQRRAG